MGEHFLYFCTEDFRHQLETMKPEQVIPFFSEGHWSLHDLLSWLLEKTGPAEVWLSTFSISEAAIRTLAMATQDRTVSRLHCLFDPSIQKTKSGLLYFATSVATEIAMAPNHSKLLLIGNEEWKISVVGSMNLTPNPRKEAGVIFTTRDTFYLYRDLLEHSIRMGIPLTF